MKYMKEEKNFLNKLLKPKDVIVFACSGGPDSMCLLNLLWEQKTTKEITLICAHINHNQRVESEEEWKFVKKYCTERNIIFEGMKIKTYSKENFHKEAHQKRKEFYEQLVKKYHANYLMTGHHGDDLIETVLMRLTRGSSIQGYKGFSKIQKEGNYTLVRPLITATKDQIKEYNIQNNIPYATDKSNEKDKYTRNRYRHHILPFLKKENKNVHQQFLRFNEELCRINEFLVKFTKNALTECLEFDTLHIVEIKKQDDLIQREIIKMYLYSIYHDEITLLTEKHIESILALIHSSKCNQEIHLPKNYRAKKYYNSLKVEKDNKEEHKIIELNDRIQWDNKVWIEKIENSQEKNNFVIRLNSNELKFPLMVRTRRNDDKIEVKNATGHQKVNRIFIDKKVPLDERSNWPIVMDGTGQIIWIPGLKKSKFDKEIKEKYDIIYKYNVSKERIYATKK